MSRQERRRLEREARSRRAARTALLDQADAAGRDAFAALLRLAGVVGDEVRFELRPGPIMRALMDAMAGRMIERLRAGGRDRCEHIGPRAPAPAIWYPWGEMLYCGPCATAAYGRIEGTEEMERCDHCRARVDLLYPLILLIPAVVADVAGYPLHSLPPILFVAHLCEACRIADSPDVPLRRKGAP